MRVTRKSGVLRGNYSALLWVRRGTIDIKQSHPACGADALVLQVASRSEPRGIDAVSMLLTPSLPWLKPACDGCMAYPLSLPPVLQQALPATRRRLQD